MQSVKALGLIIDDDESMHEIVKEGLGDFCFLHANSYGEALRIITSSIKFDFILLDYKLDHKKGTDLVASIKKYHKRCPIIMISAFGEAMLLKQLIETKIDTFIDKPVDLDFLRERICNYLKNTKTVTTSSYYDHLDFVKMDSDPGLNLKEYAKDEYLSYKYLCRRYKEVHGQSYQEHKREKILNEAKELLADSYQPVKQIAYHLGYKNPSAFMVFFKKHVGLTPKNFRKQSQKQHV